MEQRDTEAQHQFDDHLPPLLSFAYRNGRFGVQDPSELTEDADQRCGSTKGREDVQARLDVAEDVAVVPLRHVVARPDQWVDQSNEIENRKVDDEAGSWHVAMANVPYQRWEV